jgi:hypothetical protein
MGLEAEPEGWSVEASVGHEMMSRAEASREKLGRDRGLDRARFGDLATLAATKCAWTEGSGKRQAR